MDMQSLVQRIAVYALPLLLALTVREIVRGQLAFRLGDTTGFQAGRLSLNPLHHVDPIGTLVLPLSLLLLSSAAGSPGFLIGWPKLTPINGARLRNPRRDVALIAVSGLVANLLMSILWAVLLRISLGFDNGEGVWAGVRAMSSVGITINLSFLVLNLLPLLPLDMAQLLVALLPPRRSELILKLAPYSLVIFVLLAITGVLGMILQIPFALLLMFVLAVTGLPLGALSL